MPLHSRAQLQQRLQELVGDGVREVRIRGLWVGVDIDPELMTDHAMYERLASCDVLAKDIHVSTVCLAPPLTIKSSELDWMLQ